MNTVKIGGMTFGWGAGLPQYGPPMALSDELYGTLSDALAAGDCLLFVAPSLVGEELQVLSPTLETQRPLAKPGAEGQKVQVYKLPSDEEEKDPRPEPAHATGEDFLKTLPVPEGLLLVFQKLAASSGEDRTIAAAFIEDRELEEAEPAPVVSTLEIRPELTATDLEDRFNVAAEAALEAIKKRDATKPEGPQAPEEPKGVPDESPPTESVADATGDEGEEKVEDPAPPKEREGA